MDSGIIWLIAVIVFSILESVTYQLVCIWFAVGAVGAMIAAFCGANLLVQLIIFIVISVICLIFTRPIFRKMLGSRIEKTNAASLIGKTAMVTEEIDNIRSKGQVKVNGMVWTARSLTDEIINKDDTVTVEKIEGVKLIVKKIGGM